MDYLVFSAQLIVRGKTQGRVMNRMVKCRHLAHGSGVGMLCAGELWQQAFACCFVGMNLLTEDDEMKKFIQPKFQGKQVDLLC